METVLTLILIQVCAVGVIDLSGIIDSLDNFLTKVLKTKAHVPKPFSCSLCMTWWTCFFWLLFKGELTWAYAAISLGLAFLTPVVADFCYVVRNLLSRLIQTLNIK